MGFNSETKLVIKEENELIEICPLSTENSNKRKSFSVNYLFNNVISEKICDINIDIFKITALELSNCNLTDLPVSCKKLNLKHLGLSCNKLKHVPVCLYNGLKYLESLDLSCNRIQNFDMEPDCLPYLKNIKLDDNEFDNVPKWILMFRCTHIEQFNYSHNKSSHYNFMKNSFNLNLMKLKKLELVNSCLIDKDFNFLKCFKDLMYLDISNTRTPHINRFDDLDNLFVKPKWKELSVLKLNGLLLSIFPEGIPWLEQLKELHICNNSLSWLPDSIGYLVNLEVLKVANNDLISLPNALVFMDRLAIIEAANNFIEVVPDLSSMSNLKTVDLYNNLTSTILFDVNSVQFVDLEYNYFETRTYKNFSLYKEKKNNLRKKYFVEGRGDGPKIRESEILSETSSEDSYYESLNPNKILTVIGTIDENENWDLPPKTSNISSDIDSEDDRWEGERETSVVQTIGEIQRVYISDDDWMFADFDEN